MKGIIMACGSGTRNVKRMKNILFSENENHN